MASVKDDVEAYWKLLNDSDLEGDDFDRFMEEHDLFETRGILEVDIEGDAALPFMAFMKAHAADNDSYYFRRILKDTVPEMPGETRTFYFRTVNGK